MYERQLSPTELTVLRAVIIPSSANQIRAGVSMRQARDVPASTVSGALSNLCRWGVLEKERKPNSARTASLMIYRRAIQ